MSDVAGVELRPRALVSSALLVGSLVCAVPAVVMVLRAATADDQRVGYAVGAVALGVVGVLLPLLLWRSVTRTRLRVSADAVSRVAGEREVTRLRLAEATEIRVSWQVSPGLLGRRPIVALLGPATGGARGIVANGLLVADLEPLLDRVAAEVARRPDVLTSDRSVYEAVLARRPYS